LLRNSGICAALKALCQDFGKAHGIPVNVELPAQSPVLSDEVGLCFFRVSQECLQNIAKHSGAGGVNVALGSAGKQVRLKISDTGRGFDPSEAGEKGGLGLLSMRERVLSIGGHLELTTAPGAGTEVCVTVPLDQAMMKRIN
jgi:signal transduction histidine kinase